MRNSKVLKVAICSALVASVAATAAISVSAMEISEIKDHKVGICGAFTDWAVGSDIPMTDDDGDGVFEGVVELESVKKDWITDWNKDDKPTGEQHVQFKVRLDNDWAVNWANYEPGHDRVFDAQCNLAIMEDVKEGDHIKFTVFLDTNKNNPDAVAAYDPDEMVGVSGDAAEFEFLYAGYKDFENLGSGAAPAEEKPAEEKPAEETPAEETPAEETPAEETPAEETPADTTPADDTDTQAPSDTAPADTTGPADTTKPADTSKDADKTTPATGDTTSAIALVAVVLASLGTAVVMTKKASAKD